jgi:hypothetical protein
MDNPENRKPEKKVAQHRPREFKHLGLGLVGGKAFPKKAEHPIEVLRRAYNFQEGDICEIVFDQLGTGSTKSPRGHSLVTNNQVIIRETPKTSNHIVYVTPLTPKGSPEKRTVRLSIMNIRPTGKRWEPLGENSLEVGGIKIFFDINSMCFDIYEQGNLHDDLLTLGWKEVNHTIRALLELNIAKEWPFRMGCLQLSYSTQKTIIAWIDTIASYIKQREGKSS